MDLWHLYYLNHGDLIVFIILILLMNYVEFWVKEVFKCREKIMMPWDGKWTKSQAWGCPLDTPRNIQEVQASKLGDAQGTPSSSIKSTRSFFNALYFYCCMHYVLFLERIYFLLYVYFVYLLNKVGPIIFFGERHAPQFLYRTL